MTKPDLVGSPVAATTTLESISTPKISRKMAIIAALVAIAAIALVYAEVKYRFVSTIVSFVIANPLIMGVIALVAVIGMGYLLYRNQKHSNTNNLRRDEETHVDTSQENTPLNQEAVASNPLDQEVDRWINERVSRYEIVTDITAEPPIGSDVQGMTPVSEAELVAAMRTDLSLQVYFETLFNECSSHQATLDGAKRILNFQVRVSEWEVCLGNDQTYRNRHEQILTRGPLALRWLMNPMILNQNNNTTN